MRGLSTSSAWLLVPAPAEDVLEIDWPAVRAAAAVAQRDYWTTASPMHCYISAGLFGLSSAEVPEPGTALDPYEEFGVGHEDGTALLGHPVAVPHYAAMAAKLPSSEATTMWAWLVEPPLMTPLNNVESLLAIDESGCENIVWNSLRGSLNLGFQALGWGAQLAGSSNPLHAAAISNTLLHSGYRTIVSAIPSTTGVFRSANGGLFLKSENTEGFADRLLTFGLPNDRPVSGDWDGSGVDTIGVFRPSNGVLFLKNQNSTGFADIVLTYGLPEDKPVTGDWDGDGIDTIGVFRDGVFLLSNSNTNGFAEIVFGLGLSDDEPISGAWGEL